MEDDGGEEKGGELRGIKRSLVGTGNTAAASASIASATPAPEPAQAEQPHVTLDIPTPPSPAQQINNDPHNLDVIDRSDYRRSHRYSASKGAPLSPSISRVQSVNRLFSRVATGFGTSIKDVLWKGRPPGPTDASPEARAFRIKLGNAFRPALACFLATGISMVYPWSNKVTWFSITLSISNVGRNLGHTLEGFRQQWLGVAVAVPLCLLLGLCSFSKALTGLLVFLVTLMIAATDLLTEPAKKLCIIFVVWDVLIPVVSSITIVDLMTDLLTAVLGANIVCVVVMLLPVPHLAIWICRWRLEELYEVMGRFLEDTVDSFCLEDDSELYDLEEVIDEAATLLREIRALLPDVRVELSLFFGRDRAVSYDRLVRYLAILEGQMENCRGMAVAVTDLCPNATHEEFIRSMRPGLLELVRECQIVLQGTCHHICDGLRFNYTYDDVPAELFVPPKAALTRVLSQCLKTRMRVVYGVELQMRELSTPLMTHGFSLSSIPSSSVSFKRSEAAAAAAKTFVEESQKVGYMNLLPRNAFVLDLELFVEAFEMHHNICNSRRHDVPVLWSHRTLAWVRRLNFHKTISSFRSKSYKAYRQPLKVALAVLLASIVVLADDEHIRTQAIWAPITVAQTMSSHPSSAFKSGANRAQGTVLGAIFGLAVTQWAPIRSPVLIVMVLTLWVFICDFNRGSPTYGEVAVSAALTAPIVVVGPVVGSSGAVVRISQVILGTVIYVALDNLIFPVRAKLLLRAQLVESVQHILRLCQDGLATFLVDSSTLRGNGGSLLDYDITQQDNTEKIRDGLQKEALYISLASDEPELWHKPFQRATYLKAHSIQMRMHRYLLMLHRASVSFPKELAECDQQMLNCYESIIVRLQSTVEAVLNEALARLQLLKKQKLLVAASDDLPSNRPSHISLSKPTAGAGDSDGTGASNGSKVAAVITITTSNEGIPCVNLFDVRHEFDDIQDTIDELVVDFFAKDVVLTSLNFIVPLNGMIYSTRKMSAECINFVSAVRQLMSRERKVGAAPAALSASQNEQKKGKKGF